MGIDFGTCRREKLKGESAGFSTGVGTRKSHANDEQHVCEIRRQGSFQSQQVNSPLLRSSTDALIASSANRKRAISS